MDHTMSTRRSKEEYARKKHAEELQLVREEIRARKTSEDHVRKVNEELERKEKKKTRSRTSSIDSDFNREALIDFAGKSGSLGVARHQHQPRVAPEKLSADDLV